MRQATYEIHLDSEPPAALLAELRRTSAVAREGETVLLTVELDREGLHDLVTRLRDLGIELVELHRVTSSLAPHRGPHERH